MSTVKIASVHFAPIHLDRFRYQGIYDAPGVKPGGDPVFVQQTQSLAGQLRKRDACTDMVELERGSFSESGNPRARSLRRTTILGEEIAADLVNEWTRLVHGATTEPPCYPGIWVVRDRLPETDEEGKPIVDAENRQVWREATDEEKKAMWDEDLKRCRLADSNYARSIFDHWNGEIERHPRFIETLPNTVRIAAEAYGFQADWLRESKTAIEMKSCQHCGKKVSASTTVCPQCHEVIDYEKFALEMRKKQEALARHGITEPVRATVADAVIAGVSGPPPKPTKAA